MTTEAMSYMIDDPNDPCEGPLAFHCTAVGMAIIGVTLTVIHICLQN